jgi:hypothetical protein
MKEHITPWQEMPIGTLGTIISINKDYNIGPTGIVKTSIIVFKIPTNQQRSLYPHSKGNPTEDGFELAYLDPVGGFIDGFNEKVTEVTVKWYSLDE